MKFGQQKFLIGALLTALPLMAVFSLGESPVLSRSLLKFSLRFVNFRTGVPVSAKAWDLHPSTFSASLFNVDFAHAGIYVRAAEIEVQLSPVDLIFGVLKFRNVTTRGLSLRGRVPEKWFESDPNKASPAFVDLPGLASKALQEFNEELASQNLGLAELAIENASLDFSNLKIKNLNLRLVNQSRGQARLDVSLDAAEIPQKLSPTPNLSLSLSLVREAKNQSVFLLRSLRIGQKENGREMMLVSGRVPGRLSSRLSVNLNELNLILKNGAWTKDYYQPNLSGALSGTLGFVLDRSNTWQLLIEELAATDFVYDDYQLRRLDISADYDSKKQINIRKAVFTLPHALSDPKSWQQVLAVTSMEFKKDGSVEGVLSARELGLCSIMIATGVNECFASTQINGPANFSGTLAPLKLSLTTDWTMSPATVFTEPEVPGRRGSAPLLHTNAAKFRADVMIFDKYLTVLESQMLWGTTKIALKGEVKYIPTKVELDLNSTQVELSDVMSDFLDLPVSGMTAIKSQILYDYSIPKRVDRTKVFGAIEIDKLAYGGQPIGQLNAPLLYEQGDLNIGPASLASGGGTAILRGVLQNRPEGKSRLEASATLRRYETSIVSSSGAKVVHGFYTGVLKVDGFLSETASQTGIRGRISGSLDSAEVLGIGLARIEGALSLRGSDLVLDELIGQKNKQTIKASGLISATDGQSFVNFEGSDLDVVGLGWDAQIESLFSAGKVSLSGKWSDLTGYKISGKLSGLADPTYAYGNGSFEASGNDKALRFDVKIAKEFSMAASATYRGDDLSFDSVQVALKDQGVFLGLSYLNEWKEKVDLNTTGSLNLDYTDTSGLAVIDNLRIRRHNASGKLADVLFVPGKHALNWDAKSVKGERFTAKTATGDLTVAPADGRLNIGGKWSSDLIDILIPDFVRLRDGYAEGIISMGLPFSPSRIRGDFALNGVSIGVNGLGRYGQNSTGEIEFRDSRILFKNVKSNFGSGYADVNGEYKLDWKNPGIYLNVNLASAEFVFINEVPAVTSGALVLSGNSYPFDVRGRVSISDGLYAAESSSSTPVSMGTASPILNFDIGIDLGAKFAVRNALVSTNATGTMKLIGTDVNPSFVGVVQLENGRVFARDNEFKIIRGVVDFPANSKNIFINVTATTDIKTSNQTYAITLNATGTTDEPNIEFQSNPPLALPDIASLLAFGVVRSEESDDSASTSLADTARAEALQTIFGKTIGSTLRKKAGLDVRVSARAALDKEQTIPKVTVVRKLSKKVTATFGRSLDFSRPENNVQIDYELLRNVNVSGVWENPNPKESSVGFDLRFKWDVK